MVQRSLTFFVALDMFVSIDIARYGPSMVLHQLPRNVRHPQSPKCYICYNGIGFTHTLVGQTTDPQIHYLYPSVQVVADLGHVARWEPCNLHDLLLVLRVASVPYSPCTTSHTGRLGSRYVLYRSWTTSHTGKLGSRYVLYRSCTTYHNGRVGSRYALYRSCTTYHNGRIGSRYVPYRSCTASHNGRLGSRYVLYRLSLIHI